MACATFLQTLSHRDPVFQNDLIDSFFSTNPLLAQMPSTVHLYHMLRTYGIHSPRGSSHPHLVLLKLMLCIIYNYFMCTLIILDTYLYNPICSVLPLFWVHFVLAHAICVSCALFFFCIKYYKKKIYGPSYRKLNF